ncbi:hypothetical protein MSP8886_01418 [Marinomonas spartinae]|uniref:Uncharacterized protein n=1 Tax=Marinomonas spartinae TaxID=1792290 RepID=A0A1A8TB84_9GAMM|nr:hypothetical protein [Marinomonas spartinae]SBS29055.1 hypothetical protein MSP8886_01418 [Marinomonas spartinae]
MTTLINLFLEKNLADGYTLANSIDNQDLLEENKNRDFSSKNLSVHVKRKAEKLSDFLDKTPRDLTDKQTFEGFLLLNDLLTKIEMA